MLDRTRKTQLDVLGKWILVPPLAEVEIRVSPAAGVSALDEVETGVSRAAAPRNFERLVERGLLREITGQGRYRVWTAAA